ncbi:MAG: hypothetical protein WDZ83_08390 [Rhizobiaceae bacterium]
MKSYLRDEVFVAGGQPTVTYVDRQEAHVERNLARALATPNQIVSLAGPTKTGKTVLCKKVLGEREYVWIDGGELQSASSLWDRISAELSLPYELVHSSETGGSVDAGLNVPIISAGGSRLFSRTKSEAFKVSSMGEAIKAMLADKIVLVIDDFHYLDTAERTELIRNIKGAVFNGLKVLLLSVAHRVFDAISAETELTGRFISVTLPEWTDNELAQIPQLGFNALKIRSDETLIRSLVGECQSSPFLMQKFCWEICFDHSIERSAGIVSISLDDDYDLEGMFIRLAQDAGLPIYQKLVTGPQSRKERMKRPLKGGRRSRHLRSDTTGAIPNRAEDVSFLRRIASPIERAFDRHDAPET